MNNWFNSRKERVFFFCFLFFLHCIVTSDEKWIHYNNPKHRWSCINIVSKAEYPWFKASALHLVESARRNLSWVAQTDWNQHGDHGWLKLMHLSWALEEKTAAIWAEIWQRDFATWYVAKQVKTFLETLQGESLPHLPYSSDIAQFDYLLFQLIIQSLAEQHFHSYGNAKKMGWLMVSLKRCLSNVEFNTARKLWGWGVVAHVMDNTLWYVSY